MRRVLYMPMIAQLLSAIVLILALGGCSDGQHDTIDTDAGDDHVWKEQTRMLEKAQGVEDMIHDAAEQQRHMIEQQNQ